MKKIYLIFCLVLAFSFMANAATYYVRTDGNDNNNGLTNSSAGAWKTIKASVGKLSAGDKLLVADGTYNEYEVNINFTGGSKTVRTTIQSINKWGAKLVLDGPSNQGMAINAYGVILDKFEITWAANPTANHKGIEIYGNWTTISNCHVHDCPFSGISGAYCDNVLIENNLVHDNYSKFPSENGSGISIWDPHMIEQNVGGYNIIIRNNICYNNWATSNVGSGGVPTDGNGIILDDFHNSQTAGGKNYTYKTLVENNLCFNNGGRGIHNFYSDNVTIRNNTVYGNNYILKNYHDVGELENTGGLNVAYYNNISVSTANLPGVNALKITLENSGSNITKLNNNILCGSNPFSTWTSNTTLTGGGNSGNVTNTSTTYPAFVNPTTGIGYDFHLQSSSPAINTGSNISGYYSSTDLDGLTRPQGGTTDIGCYEYNGGGSSDTQAPSIPTGLRSSAIASTSVTLSWIASIDNVGVKVYEVFANGVSKGTSATTTMNVTGLSASTAYSMTVRAGDAVGNWSAQSSGLNITTLAGTVTNLLLNPGFESGITSWGGQGATISSVTTKNSGSYGLKVASRTANWGGPIQSVLSGVSGAGSGTYYAETYIKMASSSAQVHIIIHYKYNNTDYYISTPNVTVGTAWTKVSGTLNINYTGTLQACDYYIETVAGKTIFYADDCYLGKGTTKSATVITGTTAVKTESTAKMGLNIYPNPVVGEKLTIAIKDAENMKEGNVSIFDIQGRKVYKSAIISNDFNVNTSSFTSGVYFVKLNSQNEVVTKKMIVR